MPVLKSLTGVDLMDIFPPDEGSIDFIYGRIGTGKTLLATVDILKRLRRGEVVYCNWRIDVPSISSELESRWQLFKGLIGLKRDYYAIDVAKNLVYFPIDDEYAQSKGYEDFTDWLSRLTDCSVYLDEGHAVFDSYQHAKFSLRKRMAILTTRHFNRRIVVVSQRPTAIHVSARANVNRFFKCERPLAGLQKLFGILFFVKIEYQDMTDETVDEDSSPVSVKWYLVRMFGFSKAVLKAYNSKYMRGDMPTSQFPVIQVYFPSYAQKLYLLIPGALRRLKARSAPPIASGEVSPIRPKRSILDLSR